MLGGPGHLSRSTLQGTSVQHRQPVPIRPHLPISPTTATLVADFLAYKNDDTNARTARMGGAQPQRQVHEPSPRRCRHQELRRTRSRYVNICTIFKPRPAIPTNDHANKTWGNHRMDIENNIINNITGTSWVLDVHIRQRERSSHEWRRSPSRFE